MRNFPCEDYIQKIYIWHAVKLSTSKESGCIMVLVMKSEFSELTLHDKKIFDKYAASIRGCFCCEYSFPFTYIEGAASAAQICERDGMAIVRTRWSGERVYNPPLLGAPDKLFEAVEFIEQQAQLEEVPLDIRGLPKVYADMLDTTKYAITVDRGQSEYVYKASDLIHLAGKQFHSKRNFIQRFYKSYDYVFRAYDENIDRATIFELIKKWTNNTEHEKWEFEEMLLKRALDAYRELDLKIAVLYVKTELVAFSISFIANAQIAFTFFEKADTDYIGAYQVINQRTAQMFFGNIEYVNRECDMGVDGLRKAKLSYNPVMLIDKYRVQHK